MPDRVIRELGLGSPSPALGHVVTVTGARLTATIEEAGAGLALGAIVQLATGRSTVFGLVSNIAAGAPHAVAEIEFLGEIAEGTSTFRRGVSRYPTLGQAVHVASHDDLALVYARPDRSTIRIGTLFQDPDIPVFARTDELLGKHCAVLGTTGSGKSCAVSLILSAILDQHPNGHIVLLDPHSEYAGAFGDKAEILNPDTLQLPYWLLDFEEARALFTAYAVGAAEAESGILATAILAAKKKFLGATEAAKTVTVDTPVPYSLSELIHGIDAAMGQLDKPEDSAPYLRLKARIESLKIDRRFRFLFPGLVVRDNLAAIVSRIIRVPVDGKPITVINLAGIPAEIVDVVVSVLCRMIFDVAVWSEAPGSLPVLLVCEEAHRYVPARDDLGFGPTKRAIARIAKEGRKYGVSLLLVSQRPAELSAEILSQCNTLFALRLGNDRDQELVRRVLPESALSLMNALTAMGGQEAVAVGEGVPVSMRLRFDDVADERRPRSATSRFTEAWQGAPPATGVLEKTIERWRHQTR